MTGDKPVNGATMSRLILRIKKRMFQEPRQKQSDAVYAYLARVGTYQKY